MNILRIIIGLSMTVLSLISCDTTTSLQVYIVDKQEDDRFMKVDIATSLIKNTTVLSADKKEILKTIKKINVVAYQKDQGTETAYQTEKAKLDFILSQEKYKSLISFKTNNQLVHLKYLGNENTIDEVIVYGTDTEKGLVVFRLLGDNMKPENLATLAMSLEKGDLDLSVLTGLKDVFKD